MIEEKTSIEADMLIISKFTSISFSQQVEKWIAVFIISSTFSLNKVQ